MKKTNIISAITFFFSMIVITSCTSADDQPTASPYATGNVSDATVTFTYNVPAELMQYVMLDACYNNNSNTDMIKEPVLGTTFKVTYRLSSFPITAPVVFVPIRTNRPVAALSGSEPITMTTTVRMTIGDREIEQDNVSSINVTSVDDFMKDVHKRTYAVKINKKGEVNFVTPNNY